MGLTHHRIPNEQTGTPAELVGVFGVGPPGSAAADRMIVEADLGGGRVIILLDTPAEADQLVAALRAVQAAVWPWHKPEAPA